MSQCKVCGMFYGQHQYWCHSDTVGAQNPYAGSGWKDEAWRKGYQGFPMIAAEKSAYEVIYKEGIAARKKDPTK